jgi:hypothetical protein
MKQTCCYSVRFVCAKAIMYPPSDDAYRKRRLRLGALLYQLRYFAVTDERDADGEIRLYRRDPGHWVEVDGTEVRLVGDATIEVLDLKQAIARCVAARLGTPLHQSAPGNL